MPMKPGKDESQSEFMSRCVPEMIGTGADKRPQDQAVAICADIWRNNNKQVDVDPPDDDETYEDFMDRCTDEADQESCQMIWDERKANRVVHKTHAAAEVIGMEFILSDESTDRMGDIIEASGWDFDSFKKNPIALFNHRSDFPIGKWNNIRIAGKELRGHLEIAPKGTSERIDEIRKLIDAGILKAVSVGFRPIDYEPLDKKNPFSGLKFTKQELIETSLVSVPANPNALAVAKSLNISRSTIDLVFAEHGEDTRLRRRGFTGEHAERTPKRKGKTMTGLGQRIADLQAAIVAKQDELTALLDKMDDSNVSDADLEAATKIKAELAQLDKTHALLVDSEKVMARGSDSNNGRGRAISTVVLPPGGSRGNGHDTNNNKPEIAAPAILKHKKELEPLDYLVRAATVTYACRAWGGGRHPDEIRQKIYGDDEITKVVCDLVMRAASAPALTTVTGWAAELVQTQYADLMPLLMPKAILTRLAARGLALTFGRSGRIVIPSRSRTPSLAGSFVGEGMPIPVRQGAFTSAILTPKKMAVITTWTHEMDEHSIPAIEGLLREAIQQDTTVAVDSVLIDTNPATVVRPPGLLNGVAATTATAGGGITALIGDIKALTSALVASTYGNLRTPVWLLNPGDILAASLTTAPNTGLFPFREEIKGGTLNTVPFIDSATVPAKTMILVDAADFVVVGGEAPRMEMSDQATLHMEDTTPLELVASPSTVAAPQRSLFQTDSLALRMILPLNWVQRRAGTIAWTQNVTWS
jgi:HK97 family phage prohead protease/HK97 family phage major capsid protein